MEKVEGIRSINGRYKLTEGRGVKNSIRNREAKKLVCMTHGHELKGRNVGGRGRE